MANVTHTVRQVHRGFWTYDLQFHDEGSRIHYSVGECHSRRDAERKGAAAARMESIERDGGYQPQDREREAHGPA